MSTALRRTRPLGVTGRVLVLLLAVSLLLAPPATPRTQASGAGLVLEALGVLRERYVDPVDSAALLNAAIGGLRSALSASGIHADLGDLPQGAALAAAEAQFRLRFDAASGASGGRLSQAALAYAAIRAMTAVFDDSHTGFVTPEENRERILRQRQQAAFSGTGIVLMSREGKFYVRDVIPGGPAEAAGMRALDRIVRIDGTSTAGLQISQVAGTIRGPSGTQVTLTLERPGSAGTVAVTLVRAPIHVPAIFQARVMEGGVGHLHLYQFISRTGAEFRQALERVLGGGARAVVLDLRANSGGYLHELAAVLNLLLPSGRAIYQETSRGGVTRTVRTSGVPILPSHVPLVVLIDESSASAAELLAAALQEHGRATLVGAKTSGAVEAGIFQDLSDGSALSVTVLRLASGLGRRLEGVGVSPDVAVALSLADLDGGRDSQLVQAVALARQRLGLSRAQPPAAAVRR